MRFAAAMLLAICALAASGQKNIWEGVSAEYDPPKLDTANLTHAQKEAVASLLRKTGATGGWDCGGDQLNDLIAGLQISEFPAGAGKKVVLVEAGEGCARGGQGSNGAMWLVSLDSGKPRIVASPKDGFSGWIFTIRAREPYPDVVLGWHMGADESYLNYLRFDGKRYRVLGHGALEGDSDKIIPKD
jgi:hypothetical protein